MLDNAKPETVTLVRLGERISERHDITKGRSKAIVDSMRDCIVDALSEGKSVNLWGLGTFHVVTRKERVGRNPRTGESVSIPALRKIRFKPSKGIKEAIKLVPDIKHEADHTISAEQG